MGSKWYRKNELCMHDTDQTNKGPRPTCRDPHACVEGHPLCKTLTHILQAMLATACDFLNSSPGFDHSHVFRLWWFLESLSLMQWKTGTLCSYCLYVGSWEKNWNPKLESQLAPRLPAPFFGDVAIVPPWAMTASASIRHPFVTWTLNVPSALAAFQTPILGSLFKI